MKQIDKFFLMLLVFFFILNLCGCATTGIVSDVPKVQPNIDIMKDCEEFIVPKDGTLTAFANALYDNKLNYVLCNSQNNAKKEFILDISK